MYTNEKPKNPSLVVLPGAPKTRTLKRGPREKALTQGIQCLSNHELVMMILGSGTMTNPIDDLARQVLPLILKALPSSLEPKAFEDLNGIGNAKASVISGCLELARRCFMPAGRKIQCPGDAFPLVSHFGHSKQEHFLSIPLNGAHEVLGIHIVSIGLVNRTVVHPREVFAPALESRAATILVAHNHPSGNLQPSNEDRIVTRRLRDAGEILGIPLLDHLIFSGTGFISLLEDQGFD